MKSRNAEVLTAEIAPFRLNSGVFSSEIEFQLLINATSMHHLLLYNLKQIESVGDIPIRIQCLLIPFTIHLSVQDLMMNQKQALQRHLMPDIAHDIQQIIQTIIHTIGLNRVHVTEQQESVTAFSQIQLFYQSLVHWSIPAVSIKVAVKETPLIYAGFNPFQFGRGKADLQVFASVLKRDTGPLQDVIQSFLTGHDVKVNISGSDPSSDCYLQQVLNEFQVPVVIAAQIDGKPILLQDYNVKIQPQQLDSRTKTCKITVTVVLVIHNPLPMDIQVDKVLMEAKFRNSTNSHGKEYSFGRLETIRAVDWPAHAINNLSFSADLIDFDSCLALLHLYVQNDLSVSLEKGKVDLKVAGTNFSIPFQVKNVPVPSIQQAIN